MGQLGYQGQPPSTSPGPAGGAAPVSMSHAYASIISAYTNVGIVSALFLLQPAAKRNFLALRNASATANIYIEFSNQATTNSWLELLPAQIVLFDTVVPQNDLYAIADAAGAVLAYGYSTTTD